MRDDYVPTGRALKGIRYLETQRTGVEVSGPDLAAVIGVLPSAVPATMERSVEAGYVDHRRVGHVNVYCLGSKLLPPDASPVVNVRVTIWSCGGVLVENGAARPLTDAQRAALLDAIGAI